MSSNNGPKIIDLRSGANTMDSLVRMHPLQRLDSPSRSHSALVHVTGLVSFFFAFQSLSYFPSEFSEGYGGYFEYLTVIALSIATLTFIFGLLADITLSPKLFLVKNVLGVASAPLEVLITLLYWGISAIDRSLVMPPGVHLDTFVDFSMHLFPALLLLIDTMFLSPPWTIGVLPALVAPTSIAIGYWFWIEHCYTHNGMYPYPMLNQLETGGRLAVFVGSAATAVASTLILKWAYGKVNGRMGAAVPGDVKRK